MLPNADGWTDRLVSLGVEPDAAKAYTTLWILGRAKAGAVAQSSGLSRPQTYRALDQLVQLGYVTRTLSNPVEYDALPPVQIIALIHASLRGQDESLSRVEIELAAGLDALRKTGDRATSATPRFAVLHGREAVIDAFCNTIRTATKTLDFLAAHTNPRFYERVRSVFDALQERASQGVKVRFVLSTHPAIQILVDHMAAAPGIEIRQRLMPSLAGAVVADGASMVHLLAADPTGRMASDRLSAVATDAPSMVSLYSAMFEHTWRANDAEGTTPTTSNAGRYRAWIRKSDPRDKE